MTELLLHGKEASVVTVRLAGTAMSRMAEAGTRLIVVVQATARWPGSPMSAAALH
jgi:hypothetical protein